MELSFTLKNVLLGATLLGIVGGVLGSFALLRRQSLLGDALAHAALPGVCLGFLLSGSKDALPLLGGAMLAGVLGALVILGVVTYSRIKEDAAIGIVLSVFFGFGIVLLTYIQRLPGGNKSGLDKFLFGQAAALVERDVLVMAGVSAVVLLVVLVFYKELKLLVFDRAFASAQGLPVRGLEILLTILLVVVVVIGLQTVGVVLIIATLVTPAATARQWTDNLAWMLAISAAVGGLSGALGALASASFDKLPTGPTIVVIASLALVLSLLFAPRRGLLWGKLRERSVVWRVRSENLLKDLYRIGEAEGRFDEFVPWPLLMGVRGQASRVLRRVARRLLREGLLEERADALRLTPEGLVEAQQIVRKHRIWELYLTRKLEIASDRVHRDAEMMEHALSEETVAKLEAALGHPEWDPHGRRIPPARGVA